MLNRMYVVISAELSHLSADDNDGRSDDLYRALTSRFGTNGIDEVQGCYKGTLERSFVVQCSDHSDVGSVYNIAQKYSQESVLLVDSRNRAYLLYVESRRLDNLGVLYSSTDVPSTDAWTFNKAAGVYYYVV
ncbi:hypothetical protein Atoyac15_26 [Aeromonas phage Atoyac15]|uniref:Uncharacterized protein n=1 Tax=Aeromonas phage Atoyac15 TaxID=2767551 RepID=A0A866D1P8_9CAUD|nr:hypothetical protein Atoyac15_26 [Aeromonas phage Atoyac15]